MKGPVLPRCEEWCMTIEGAASVSQRTLPRIIPCLLLQGRSLVKTVRFKDAKYIGDPLNAVRILNEKEVAELVFLDIAASLNEREPDYDLVGEIASQCFMPFAYGGGMSDITSARRVLLKVAEKVVVNTAALHRDNLVIEHVAAEFGSQSMVVSINIKRDLLGRYRVYDASRRKLTALSPADHARSVIARGA